MTDLLHPVLAPVLIPLLAGTACVLLPRARAQLGAFVAIAAGAVMVLVAWPLAAPHWGPGAAEAQIIPLADGLLWVRLDALSAFVLAAVAVFGFLVAVYSLAYMKGREHLRTYYASLLWTLGLAAGAVLAGDLVFLLVCWGLLGVTLYLMIGTGGSDAASAAKKTFIIVGGSDCFLMLGIAILWGLAGTVRMDRIAVEVAGAPAWTAFLCLAAAAFAKAGAMPLHSWVPDCGEKAPVSVTAYLPASLDKLLGIYLLVRAVKGLFAMTPAANGLLMFIGAGTVICAVMMALVQHDLKRLLAYHAVSQVGYMVLGIGTGTAIGLAGGLFHMLNHAIYKACLFLCAGSVERETGTTDLDKLGGLARAMPWTFACCFIAAMAISGVPPLNGFVSKWMVYQGLVEMGSSGSRLWTLWLAAAMIGSALTLASFVKVLHAVYLRKPADAAALAAVRESPRAMRLPMAALAGLCALYGVLAYRLPLTNWIFPAIGGPADFAGNWYGGEATLMLGIAFGAGLVLYALTTAGKPRTCSTYIGGEIMQKVVGPDGAGLGTEDVEVSGVDFYGTIENLPVLRSLYRAAGNKLFDLYEVGTRLVLYAGGLLRAAHSGNLLAYLTWFLAGLAVVMWALMKGAGAP